MVLVEGETPRAAGGGLVIRTVQRVDSAREVSAVTLVVVQKRGAYG